jgi:membrane protein involved in colicin uptake
MIRTLSAIAISAFIAAIAAALFVLSGFAPEVEAGQSAALQKSNRLGIHVVDTGCAKQTWPDFSGSCLHGNGAKLEARLVSADRG